MPLLDPIWNTDPTGQARDLLGTFGGEVSLGDSLSSGFQENLSTNPLTQGLRYLELQKARVGSQYSSRLGGMSASLEGTEAKTPIISIEEQNDRLSQEELIGQLKPYEGETVEGLELRIKYKKEENIRKAWLSAAPDGVGSILAHFGVGLAASFLDPLNVASAFIPVIGPAKFAKILSQQSGAAGRLGARVTKGMAEGFVGSAAVEPIVLLGTSALGTDYDLYDTFANLAFGTVLGGGLHGMAGFARDSIDARRLRTAIDAISIETRHAAMRAALGQMGEGRIPVGIDNIIRMDLEQSGRLDESTGRIVVRSEDGAPISDAPATVGKVAVTVGDKVDGPGIPMQKSFRTEAQAAEAAKKLEKGGVAATVRKVGEDDHRLSIEIPVDSFIRSPNGEFLAFPTLKSANAAIKQMSDEGLGVGLQLDAVKIGDEYLLVSDVTPLQLSAIKASADEIVLPVEMPARQSGADPKSGINADNMLNDIQTSQSDNNLVFDAKDRTTHEAAERQRTDTSELETVEEVQADLDKLLDEIDQTIDVLEPRADGDSPGALRSELKAELDPHDADIKKAKELKGGLRKAAICILAGGV